MLEFQILNKTNTLVFIFFFLDGRGLSNLLIYIIVGFSIVIITGISVVVVVCCKRNPNSPDRKKGYVLMIKKLRVNN